MMVKIEDMVVMGVYENSHGVTFRLMKKDLCTSMGKTKNGMITVFNQDDFRVPSREELAGFLLEGHIKGGGLFMGVSHV